MNQLLHKFRKAGRKKKCFAKESLHNFKRISLECIEKNVLLNS